ncbi:MAG: aminopeptidase [Clostridia bacterium]|nr:aminopeptidase [Clostridia bacterium]
MISGKTLTEYARLVIKIGVNLQKGQGLEIACPVEKSQVAQALTEAAYEFGAKIVRIRWESENINRINYLNASAEDLKEIPKWFVDSKNYLVEKGFCYVAVSADDPSAYKDVPPEKIAVVAKARAKALKKFSDNVMANGIRWCVVSVPTLAWAKQVFPNSEDPEKELSNAIEKAMRLDKKNPLNVWEEHIRTLDSRAQYLNNQRFEYLVFKNSKGTNLKVGLCDDHTWTSAKERAKDGVEFVANMPTEEVFTAPHRLKADGVLFSSMPLCENGQIVDDFTITFKKGKIVDFSAKKGYETLKHLIETDEGTKRLGEVALIGKSSPIAKSGILFYNTLFDENASCHLAIGKAYPTTVKNGDKLTIKELKEKGLNDSAEHIDFMIGTKDLSVTGIKKDGSETVIFKNGEWSI